MKVVIYLLGFLWIAAGTVAILYTEDFKSIAAGMLVSLQRLWLAAIPTVMGVLLLLAAASTIHGWFIALIGGLGIAKGALIYFNPGGLFETGRTWFNRLTEQGYRLMGILALVLGTVIISWIR